MQNNSAFFINMDSFRIVTTFFFLWLAVFFENEIENIFAFTLILSFGILHGANDIKLLEKSSSRERSKKMFFVILAYYLIFVGSSLVLFYLVPILALILFILFSGYHFGEQHWVSKSVVSSKITSIFYFVYGLFILFLLFTAHNLEVNAIIREIIGESLPIYSYSYILVSLGVVTLSLGAYSLLTGKLKFNFLKQLFYLLVLFVVFNTASLLWSFAIYFILWHSIPSLADQISYLYGDLSTKHIKAYIKTSFFYWLISVVGLVILLFIFRNNLDTSLAFFFSFLAAITFPHVLVISRLNTQ